MSGEIKSKIDMLFSSTDFEGVNDDNNEDKVPRDEPANVEDESLQNINDTNAEHINNSHIDENVQIEQPIKEAEILSRSEQFRKNLELRAQNITNSTNGPHRRASTSSYKDVSSKLLSPTAATIHGQWNAVESPRDESPVTKRSSYDSNLPGTKTKYDVSSKLHSSTAAADHGKWKQDEGSVTGSLHSLTASPSMRQTRRFSTHVADMPYSPSAEISFFGDLSPTKDLYGDVQSRLMKSTKAAESGRWVSPPPDEEEQRSVSDTDKPKFEFPSRRQSIMFDELPPVPEIKQYKAVKPRFQEYTVASLNAKWVSPPEKPKPVGPAFVTNAKMGELPLLDESPDEWAKQNPFKNVASRLDKPTKAFTQSMVPKKVDAPEPSKSPTRVKLAEDSRLLSPTQSSIRGQWRADPPPLPTDHGHPALIKSKQYNKVESRLHQPTAAALHRQYISVSPHDALPTTAFGYPIEEEYRNLVVKPGSCSPRLSSSGLPPSPSSRPDHLGSTSDPSSPVA